MIERGGDWGATLGEIDWLEELHLALYEQGAKATMEKPTQEINGAMVQQLPDGPFACTKPPSPDMETRAFPPLRAHDHVITRKRDGNVSIGGGPTRCTTLPSDATGRKAHPIAAGCLDMFPDAIAAISHLSFVATEQHHPGQPVHWDRSKSTDEADTLMRHFLQRGTNDTDGIPHSVKVAWRALALLQKELEG